MSAIIKVQNLSFAYRSQPTVLQGISFEVAQGTLLTIAGPNGAGKTTLLNLLCGLLTAKYGSINIDSTPINSYSVKRLAKKVAVVRQEFVPVFDFTVTQVVSMARIPYLGTFGFEGQADRKYVDEAIEMTDMSRFSSRPLAELSGGERQRVFIARALAQSTPILLLDEPTSFLDLKHQVGIYDLLKTLQIERGKTIVAVTHDINLAAQYADAVLLLGADGTYQYGFAKDVFSPEKLKKIFDVSGFTGIIGRESFFIPLGKLAKDSSRLGHKSDGSST